MKYVLRKKEKNKMFTLWTCGFFVQTNKKLTKIWSCSGSLAAIHLPTGQNKTHFTHILLFIFFYSVIQKTLILSLTANLRTVFFFFFFLFKENLFGILSISGRVAGHWRLRLIEGSRSLLFSVFLILSSLCVLCFCWKEAATFKGDSPPNVCFHAAHIYVLLSRGRGG